MCRVFSVGVIVLLAASIGLGETVAVERRYEYRMRGEIRFLLFWLGRDAVGGGHVSIRSPGSVGDTTEWEEVEVLFGSNPDRVPGKVSRWGYAVERAYYNSGRQECPTRTEFTGFMRYSPEQSAREAYALRDGDPSRRYYANSTTVTPDRTDSEIRFFEEPAGFNYLQAQDLISRYFRVLRKRAPDVRREIINMPRRYETTQGMLTALLRLTRLMAFSGSRQKTIPARSFPPASYVFNARVYELKVLSARREKTAIDAEFETYNPEKGTRNRFRLVFPVSGANAGIPTQIFMQPRWWLRLRLDLVGVKP